MNAISLISLGLFIRIVCWILSKTFYKCNEVIMSFFVFQSIYKKNYIYPFMCVKLFASLGWNLFDHLRYVCRPSFKLISSPLPLKGTLPPTRYSPNPGTSLCRIRWILFSWGRAPLLYVCWGLLLRKLPCKFIMKLVYNWLSLLGSCVV